MSWVMVGSAAGAVGGSLITANASGRASGQQSAATDRAIAADNAKYEQSRTDLAPYREAGRAALTRLNSLLGLSGGVDESDPRFQDIKNRLISENDQLHQDKYGMSIFDPRSALFTINGAKDRWDQMIQEEARKQYTAQNGTTAPTSDQSPLLRKFSQSDLESDPVYQNGLEFGRTEGEKAIERRAAAGGSYDSGETLKALTRFGNDYGSTKANESYGRFRDFQDATYGKLAGIAGMGSGATNVGVGANTAAGSNLANLYTGQGNAAAAATLAGSNALTGGINNAMGYYYLNKLSGGGQRTTTSPGVAADPSMPGGY